MMTDDEIEALAKKHIAPHADRLANIRKDWPPYQQTEQFRRVKAFVRDVEAKLRAPVADERAAFEAEYAKMLHDRDTPPTFAAFMRNPDGSYALPIVERAWAMWQARAALASAPVADHGFKIWKNSDNAWWNCRARLGVGGQGLTPEEAVRDWAARNGAKASAPVADTLPHWEEVSAKLERDETLTPLEFFIYENEPAGGDAWRDQLAAALACAPVAGEAQPVAWLPDGCGPTKDPGIAQAWRNLGRNVRPLVYGDAAPQASEADPLQGAADWLMRAFEPPLSASDLARQLVIGYNRATRLRDAALSAQPGAQRTGGSEAQKPVGTLLNQHGEILWHRKPEYFPADFYAAPQANKPGYALVPIEPTKEMLTAAFELFELAVPGYATGNDARRAIYKAMVGAAK